MDNQLVVHRLDPKAVDAIVDLPPNMVRQLRSLQASPCRWGFRRCPPSVSILVGAARWVLSRLAFQRVACLTPGIFSQLSPRCTGLPGGATTPSPYATAGNAQDGHGHVAGGSSHSRLPPLRM